MFLTQSIETRARRFLAAAALAPLLAACTDGSDFGPQPEERRLTQAAEQAPPAFAGQAAAEEGEASDVVPVSCPPASDALDEDDDETSAAAEKSDCLPAGLEAAETKLQRVQTVTRRGDIYQLAESVFADMDLDKNGVLSGDELDPNSMFVQAYMLNASTSSRNSGDSQGSVSAALDEEGTSMFISDFVNPITEYFDSSDADGDGTLDAEEGRMFARFLYPDEAQLVERRDRRE